MKTSVFRVDGMSCEHCVKAITKAVGELPGVGNVTVDLKSKTVSVEHDSDQSPLGRIKAEIEDQGYDVIE